MNSQSYEINELAKALSKCQSELSHAAKDSNNPHYRSKYADLSSIWDAIRDPLTKNGLAVTQCLDYSGDNTYLISILMHSSGQWIRSIIPVINANKSSQGQGAGITYARRYALAAIVGCVQDDDDGETANGRGEVHKKPKSYNMPSPPPEDIISPSDIDPPMNTPPIEYVDQVTWEFFKEELLKATKNYQKTFWDYLHQKGITSHSDLPVKIFDKLNLSLKEHLKER